MKISGKGQAFLWGIESGLIPEIDGCYDTEQFDKFWMLFENYYQKNIEYFVRQMRISRMFFWASVSFMIVGLLTRLVQ